MKITHALAALLLASTASTAYAASTQEFVTKAAIANQFEIESSKVAVSRAQNAEVKKLAQQMITDHTKAGNEFKAALAKSNSGAKAPTGLDEKHAEIVKDLKETKADDFDAAYLDVQEDAHDDAIALFEDYSKNGDNAALKEFAAKTLPTLKKHEEHVTHLDDKDVGDDL